MWRVWTRLEATAEDSMVTGSFKQLVDGVSWVVTHCSESLG